jgi:hypothetical protein
VVPDIDELLEDVVIILEAIELEIELEDLDVATLLATELEFEEDFELDDTTTLDEELFDETLDEELFDDELCEDEITPFTASRCHCELHQFLSIPPD